MMRFNESPDPPPPDVIAPGSENMIMHASMRIGESEIMASDGGCTGRPDVQAVCRCRWRWRARARRTGCSRP